VSVSVSMSVSVSVSVSVCAALRTSNRQSPRNSQYILHHYIYYIPNDYMTDFWEFIFMCSYTRRQPRSSFISSGITNSTIFRGKTSPDFSRQIRRGALCHSTLPTTPSHHTRRYTRTHAHSDSHSHSHSHAPAHTHPHIQTHTHTHVCMCVCVYVWSWISRVPSVWSDAEAPATRLWLKLLLTAPAGTRVHTHTHTHTRAHAPAGGATPLDTSSHRTRKVVLHAKTVGQSLCLFLVGFSNSIGQTFFLMTWYDMRMSCHHFSTHPQEEILKSASCQNCRKVMVQRRCSCGLMFWEFLTTSSHRTRS